MLVAAVVIGMAGASLPTVVAAPRTAAPNVAAGAPRTAAPAFASGDYVLPVRTKVTPYFAGTTLHWTASDQLVADGTIGPNFAANLRGVASGPPGIVETGLDNNAGRAASWVSADGGVSWAEHIVAGSPTGFESLAAHAGVFVTHSDGFWSSTDGATWTQATTGPQALQRAILTAGPRGFIAFTRNGSSTITRVWLSATGAPGSWVAAPVQRVVSSFCPSSVVATTSRIIAVGHDCAVPSRARVLTSTTGRTWVNGVAPTGLRVTGAYTRAPSINYLSNRFLVTGANATQSATWAWTTSDGLTWRHVSSMPRVTPWSVDTIVSILRVGPGWLAIGQRDMPADDAVPVVWRSADLVHWSRFSPPNSPCDATVDEVLQATVAAGRLVAVGAAWSIGSSCGETWTATVTP